MNTVEVLSVADRSPYLSSSSDCGSRRVRRRCSVAVDDASESEQSWMEDGGDGNASATSSLYHHHQQLLSWPHTLPAPIALPPSSFAPFSQRPDCIDHNRPPRLDINDSIVDQFFAQDDELPPSYSIMGMIDSPLTSPSPMPSPSSSNTDSDSETSYTPEPSLHFPDPFALNTLMQQSMIFSSPFSTNVDHDRNQQIPSTVDSIATTLSCTQTCPPVSVACTPSPSIHSWSVGAAVSGSLIGTEHWPSEYRTKAQSVLRPSSDGYYECTMCFIPRADQYSHRTIYIHHDYLRLECSDTTALYEGCHRDLSKAMNDRGLSHRQELESRIEETRALLKNPDQVKGKRKKGNSESIIQQANNRLHMLERLLYALLHADCDIALLHHRDGDRPMIIPARLRKDDCRKTNRLLYHAKIKFSSKLENDRPVVESLRIVDGLVKE